jgi:sugar lactone lactonase YvrE
LDSQELTKLTEPEQHLPRNRFNDGKCDPAGRFWAGTMEFNGAADRGALYCLDVDHSVTQKVAPVTISNGLVWTADSKIMYYIDTAANTVRAFDYAVDTGAISGERVVVTNEGAGGFDGMSIDEDGMLWVAVFGGWGVRRYDPGTGKLLRDLRLPMSNVTSCAFGGDQLDELYVTSAVHGMDESARREQPLAGSLVKIDPGVRGVPAYSYAG